MKLRWPGVITGVQVFYCHGQENHRTIENVFTFVSYGRNSPNRGWANFGEKLSLKSDSWAGSVWVG